jgi:hypothetical protein
VTNAERALVKLTSAAVTASGGLSSCHAQADLLALEIARQLAVAVEEIDLLRFLLHEATLQAEIYGPEVVTRQSGDELGEMLK